DFGVGESAQPGVVFWSPTRLDYRRYAGQQALRLDGITAATRFGRHIFTLSVLVPNTSSSASDQGRRLKPGIPSIQRRVVTALGVRPNLAATSSSGHVPSKLSSSGSQGRDSSGGALNKMPAFARFMRTDQIVRPS